MIPQYLISFDTDRHQQNSCDHDLIPCPTTINASKTLSCMFSKYHKRQHSPLQCSNEANWTWRLLLFIKISRKPYVFIKLTICPVFFTIQQGGLQLHCSPADQGWGSNHTNGVHPGTQRYRTDACHSITLKLNEEELFPLIRFLFCVFQQIWRPLFLK